MFSLPDQMLARAKADLQPKLLNAVREPCERVAAGNKSELR
jgi:hypothetical protein